MEKGSKNIFEFKIEGNTLFLKRLQHYDGNQLAESAAILKIKLVRLE